MNIQAKPVKNRTYVAKIVRKSFFQPLPAALAIVLLLSGCSTKTPESGAVSEKTLAVEAYQAEPPPSFQSKSINSGGRCFVDTVNGQPVSRMNEVSGSDSLAIEGWAIGAESTPAPLVAVELESRNGKRNYYASAQRAVRPGLGQALKNPALDQAGLHSAASAAGVEQGLYSLRLLVGGESSAVSCDPNVLILLK